MTQVSQKYQLYNMHTNGTNTVGSSPCQPSWVLLLQQPACIEMSQLLVLPQQTEIFYHRYTTDYNKQTLAYKWQKFCNDHRIHQQHFFHFYAMHCIYAVLCQVLSQLYHTSSLYVLNVKTYCRTAERSTLTVHFLQTIHNTKTVNHYLLPQHRLLTPL